MHRDLKPDNIMITKTEARRHALVLDFGLGGFAQEAEVWALPRLTATYEFMGLGFSANFSHDLRDPDTVLAVTERAMALATRQKLYFWLAPATCSHGWARVQRGEVEQGIGEIQQGLGLMQAIGVRTSYPYHLSFLAEAHLGTGATEEGLAVVDEGLGLCRDFLDCFYEPEFHRLRGELLRRRERDAAAEASFERAIEGARRTGARSLELRAATSLGRVLRERGERDAARHAIGAVCDWFTEGLAAPDLTEGRGLLAELE